MQPRHVAEVVRLHQLCYPDQFSTRLGPGVLDLVYRAYCDDAGALGLVSTVDGRVVAAVCGVIGGGFRARTLRRYGPALAWRLAGRVLRDVGLVPELARRAGALWRRDLSGMSSSQPRRFVWRSQTVHPDWRGRGSIFPLIQALFDALRQRGVQEVYSTPDEDNQAAHWIHRVLDFELRGTQRNRDGKRQSVFVLKLSGGRPA